MKYSIVIPDKDELINFVSTANNIVSTQKDCNDIQHIKDIRGRGTSFSRHYGLMKASNDIIITTDAHMRFMPGVLDTMAKFIEDNPTTICCLKCHHNSTMDFSQPAYSGAEIHWMKEDDNGSKHILSGTWRASTETGEIGCIMGACYGFNRKFYLKMGAPWQLGVGWGNDEETISIAARLIGGKVELLPERCAHSYNARPVKPATSPYAAAFVWYNRLRNLSYLPMSDEDRDVLTEYLFENKAAQSCLEDIQFLLRGKADAISAAARMLRNNQVVSFDDYAKKWLIGHPKQVQALFTEIYEHKKWGENESISGVGSTLENTIAIRDALPDVIKKYTIDSLLDVPCGDMNWIKEVDLGAGVRYIGADIIPSIVENNMAQHAKFFNSFFLVLDICSEGLPECDAVLCRDCLGHLNPTLAKQAIKNILGSSAKYLIATTFPGVKENSYSPTGGWRAINLELHPYNLGKPDMLIDEKFMGKSEKFLGVWKIK